jgi:hypothetical protein
MARTPKPPKQSAGAAFLEWLKPIPRNGRVARAAMDSTLGRKSVAGHGTKSLMSSRGTLPQCTYCTRTGALESKNGKGRKIPICQRCANMLA